MRRLLMAWPFVVALAACSPADDPTVDLPEATLPEPQPTITAVTGDELTTYVSQQLGFSIAYPVGWTATPDVGNGFVGFWSSPVEGEFTENFNVVILSQPEELTLEQWAQVSIVGIQSNYEGFEMYGTGELTIDGMPALSHAFFVTQLGERNGILRVIALDGHVGYEFTFLASEEQFEALLPVADAIVNSFERL